MGLNPSWNFVCGCSALNHSSCFSFLRDVESLCREKKGVGLLTLPSTLHFLVILSCVQTHMTSHNFTSLGAGAFRKKRANVPGDGLKGA